MRASESTIESGFEIEAMTLPKLKALIISRTGRLPKAKNRQAYIEEARALLTAASRIPPTPPRAPLSRSEEPCEPYEECGSCSLSCSRVRDENGWSGACAVRASISRINSELTTLPFSSNGLTHVTSQHFTI